ncbi:MAG: penicillin-binding protein 2 [Parcubacteria group bacterium]|jgi:penicillin-binding protein 2
MLGNLFRRKKVLRGVEIEDSIMTITQKEKAIIETPFHRKGLDMVWYLIIGIILLLGIRVFYLSVIKGSYYADVSKGNRIRLITIKAPRGKILDKFGSVLVGNVPSMDVVVVPRDLPEDPAARLRMAQITAGILGMDPGNVETALETQNRKSVEPILLKENITQDQALVVMEKQKDLPGVSVENTAIRNYENGQIFSPIVGYDGKITPAELKNGAGYTMTDYIGKTGLEKYYEQNLRGKNGAKQVEVDSLGNSSRNLGVIQPQAGDNLFLNIDEGLQKKLYDSLASVLEKTGTKMASAVAIDPRSGGVLAMVSLPSYDNNLFSRGISNADYQKLITDPNLPLFNRTINGEYPPGSTIKPAVAAAALSEGVITPDTIIQGSGGSINIGAFRFGDWKVHGPSDVRTAIAESNDIFFYSIGGGYAGIQGLGMDRMKKYENLFGFGAPTGIDLLGESSGFIPSEQWKLDKIGERWYIGDSYHCAIGQGFITSTPLQVVNQVAAIANGGILYQPRIVNRIQKNDGTSESILPTIIRQNFISPDVMQVVREGMRKTVTDGTAQPLKDLPVAVAGKTGTAEFGGEGKTHGWFVSFAPYENPEIALVILAEGGGDGHSTGVPVTKEVYDWYFTRNK